MRNEGASWLPQNVKLFVGAGFIPPAEPRAAVNRADMESAPTTVDDVRVWRENADLA